MEQEVKREADIVDCTMPVVESPSSTPAATPTLALPSSTNEQSTLTGSGFASVLFERRERALYTSGSSSNHLSSAARGGPDGHSFACQPAGGSRALPISAAQSTNITAATELRAQTERAPGQRFNLSKTHTYWWLVYDCERGHYRFQLQRKRRAKNQTISALKRYKCAKCGWTIDVIKANNERYSETDPAGNVDFGGEKPHSADCICTEPAAADGQQHPQAAPNNHAERDVAELQVNVTRNNDGVTAKRDNMAVPHWVQRARIFEESTTTTTRTYFRTKEDYLDIKKTLNGEKQ